MSDIDDGFVSGPEPTTEVFSGSDGDAPYGRFKNGKPRKNPPKGVASPKRSREYKTRTKTDYRPGFIGIAQLAAFVTGFFSPVDAVAITDHAPAIGDGVQITADNDPKFAAAMDRVLSAGPYAALISSCMPMFVQIMHNHNDAITPEMVKSMGGRSREEVVQELMAKAA